jgi:hypothetical protein
MNSVETAAQDNEEDRDQKQDQSGKERPAAEGDGHGKQPKVRLPPQRQSDCVAPIIAAKGTTHTNNTYIHS